MPQSAALQCPVKLKFAIRFNLPRRLVEWRIAFFGGLFKYHAY